MIRFILKKETVREGVIKEEFVTVDAEVPEIERLLGPPGHPSSTATVVNLVGVELHTPDPKWLKDAKSGGDVSGG